MARSSHSVWPPAWGPKRAPTRPMPKAEVEAEHILKMPDRLGPSPPSDEMRREGQACLPDSMSSAWAWKKALAINKITTPIDLPTMEAGGIKLTSSFR